MNSRTCLCVAAGSVLLLGGCVTLPPSGPSVMVLPGGGKNFDQFRADDGECRSFAAAQIGGATAEQAQVDSAVKSAAIGTAVGAAAGAAFGGSSGAATGAGVGLLFGSAAGANSANASAYSLQRRYDIAYVQCMYSKGHQVPTTGRYNPGARTYTYSTPPAQSTPPPPPPGAPPPPPPR